MNDEKWDKIKGIVKDSFKVEEENSGELEDIPRSRVEWLVFEGPMGRIRIERTTKPVVLDKKMTYSKRMGDTAAVDYIYSEDEYSQTFKAYIWKDSDWVEINAANLGL
ncbi:MAG: hypothetical protein PHW53_04500 [Patescibacteria group bacterium]|nr:hypothetical protein [Patescibacteria group bacterium]